MPSLNVKRIESEIEKYKTNLETASMDQYKQDMADNFADEKIVDDSLHGALQQMAARGKRLGWSGMEYQQQSRELVSNMIGSAIDSALQVDEVDRAGQLLEKYGSMMDMNAYTKTANYVKKRTAIRDEKKFAESLMERCKNPDGSYNMSLFQKELTNFQNGRTAAPAAYACIVKSELFLHPHPPPSATQGLSCICNLHQSSRQSQITNSLSEARDQTCILMDSGQVCYC